MRIKLYKLTIDASLRSYDMASSDDALLKHLQSINSMFHGVSILISCSMSLLT